MASAEPTVCVKAIRAPVFAVAARTGLDLDAVAAKMGIPTGLIGDATARVAHGEAVRVWNLAARVAGSNDGTFALEAAKLLDGAPFDMVDIALFHRPDVRAMANLFARYQSLFHDANDSHHIEPKGADTVEMIFHLKEPVLRSDQMNEFILATWLIRIRRATAQNICPKLVEFRHGPPASGDSAHRAFFASEVRFNAPRDALTFARSVMDLPVAHANPQMVDALNQYLANELVANNQRRTEGIVDQVRHRVHEALLQGQCDVGRVAKSLALSERTLQRRLSESETSFQEVLDEVRRELALARLNRGDGTLTDLAFTLGYADLSAFSRAFRRWTGESPVEYRRRTVSGGSAYVSRN
jgi:AraC-like DNA-binding protein